MGMQIEAIATDVSRPRCETTLSSPHVGSSDLPRASVHANELPQAPIDTVELPTWATDPTLPSWAEVHDQLQTLAAAQRRADHAQGRLLLSAKRLALHTHFGLGSFAEYAHRHFGYTAGQVYERLRVASALEGLPKTDAALAAGELTWSATRELTRIVDADTEQEWLEDVKNKTVRQIERMVSHRRPGQLPSDPASQLPQLHTVRLALSADVLALYRDAIRFARKQTGEELDEAEALAVILRHAMSSASAAAVDGSDAELPAVALGAPYQIAITLCERCGQGFAETGGELVAVDDAVTERAQCDAQHIGRVDGSPRDVGAGPHVGAGLIPSKPARATRSVPPSVKRAVLRRQRRGCAVPGCRSPIHEIHHLEYPLDGPCREEQVLGLCGAHHRRVHEGALLIQRGTDGALSYRHADGADYGAALSVTWHALRDMAQSALVHMGFPAARVRQALVRLGAGDGEERPATIHALLRQALALLG